MSAAKPPRVWPGCRGLPAGRARAAVVRRRRPSCPARPRQRDVRAHRLPLLARGAGRARRPAPALSTALEWAAATGYTRFNLDGTVIRTDCAAEPGPGRSRLVLVRNAEAPRWERAGDLRRGRPAALGLPGPARSRARHHLRSHPPPDRRPGPACRHAERPHTDRRGLKNRLRISWDRGAIADRAALGVHHRVRDQVVVVVGDRRLHADRLVRASGQDAVAALWACCPAATALPCGGPHCRCQPGGTSRHPGAAEAESEDQDSEDGRAATGRRACASASVMPGQVGLHC